MKSKYYNCELQEVDAIVENLHLQQTRKLSDDEQKLEVIRKFA